MSSAFLEKLAETTGDSTMGVHQARLLLALYLNGTLNQTDLPKHTGVAKSAISRMIAKLGPGEQPAIRKGPGWIDTEEDPNDRRFSVVRLTALGRAVLEGAAQEVASKFSR